MARGSGGDQLGFVPQPMVRWLGPRGLSVTALQVLLSGIFGAYSDKREIQAALRAASITDLSDQDELWFDFLADHYNRYERPDGSQQRFTCGSGGTFLYPTHHLAKRIRWPEAGGPATYEQRRLYPDAPTSKRMRWGTLLAPFKNPSFVVFIGLLYLLFAQSLRFDLAQGTAANFRQALRDASPAEIGQALFNNPASFLLTVLLAGALIAFTDAATLRSRITIGLLHWLAHLLLLVAILWGAARVLVDLNLSVEIDIGFLSFRLTAFTVLFVVAVVVVGGYLGSQLFALYLFLMHTLRRRHPTHAFSCQRLEDYRSFLRIKVERDGALTVYPVGVRRVPRRWRLAGDRAPHEPAFEPVDRPLATHLIEAPIRIDPDAPRPETG